MWDYFDKLEFVDLSDFILQNMNDLQTVAFVPLAYDPVANRNDSKQKLKEVKIEKEGGYPEQNFMETASGLNKLWNAEMNDAIQDALHQRNTRSSCKRYNLCPIRTYFFTGNEIPPCRNQAEDIP